MIRSETYPRHLPKGPGVITLLKNALALGRQRHQLAQLGADALRDMGIDPQEAEAKRPVWDAPQNWRR